ncbi:Hypothetical protein HDN1F_23810 [gamma proteobacterium HdN1]|nr:Hypothetical protein HDN1F_23810 [gamma proteobacterium HdN1]
MFVSITEAAMSCEANQLREAAARLLWVAASMDLSMGLAALKRVAQSGGDLAYPRFLKMLLIISESDDRVGQARIAQILAGGLRSMDMPSGSLSAWGASYFGQASQNTVISASTLRSVPLRRWGPVEYLTLWFCQKTQRPYLSDHAFRKSLSSLITLVNMDDEARLLYPQKIIEQLSSGSEGACTRSARQRLQALSEAWAAGSAPDSIAAVAATYPWACGDSSQESNP